MKSLSQLIALALMAGMVASCDSREEALYGVDTVITANIAEAAPMSRTAIDNTQYDGGHVGILWTPSDEIGVFSDSQANARFTNMSGTSAGRVQFGGTLSGTPRYAYYPYSADNNGAQATALKGSLAAVQTYSLSTRAIDGDYKYGKPREGATGEFDFTHIFSLIRFDIEATGTAIAGQRLKAVKLTLPEGRQLAGDFTFDITNGSYSFAANTSNSIKVEYADAPLLTEGSTHTAYLSCAPDLHENDEVSVEVSTDTHKATFKALIAYDFRPDQIYTFKLKLSEYADRLTVTEVAAEPVMTSFEFTVAANPGKILDKEVVSVKGGESVAETTVASKPLTIEGKTVSGMIPYLYDFTLVPTFTVPEGVKVTVGGVEQTSGASEVDFSNPVVYTLTNTDGVSVDYTVNLTNTGLPVVVVNQSQSLTGGSWRNWFGGLSVRSKDSEWAEDDMVAVYDKSGRYTMAPNAAGVRLRGNSTQSFPKKPFAIKLVKKQAIGDMPSHKRWVLLANWLDNSMMRNNTAFAIAHATEQAWRSGAVEKGLPWNPHGISVELVIDGRHVGNYYLCEQIKINKNRLAIKDAYEDVVKDGLVSPTFENCGYLIECDDNYDENSKFITSSRFLPIMLKDDVPADILSQIQTKINRIEQNIVNGNYAAAYEELDINSIIDQWIVFELTMNDEYKHPKSVYLYIDGDSKLCAGPVWDFDYQTFPNEQRISSLNSTWGGEASRSTTQWLYSISKPSTKAVEKNESDMPYMWYPLLFKDATFRQAVQSRWAAIYPYLQQVEASVASYADAYTESWKVNKAMWPLAFRRSNVTGWAPAFSGDEDMATYQDVVLNLQQTLGSRLAWMNNAITSGNFVTTAQ